MTQLYENRSLSKDARTLIITARLEPATQEYFDALRNTHFPPERNYLFAHLTMFHALPGDGVEEVKTASLRAAARRYRPVAAEVCGLRSLGGGVAFKIHSPKLEKIREEIASAFDGRLTRQDRQTWRPHITVQNKVNREVAAELLGRLAENFQPWAISLEGLDLWRYDGGSWDFESFFPFGIAN